MKRTFCLLPVLALSILLCLVWSPVHAKSRFLHVDGQNIVRPDGTRLLIKGTNLGNWMNPEGYMFGFGRTSSPHFIDEALCQLVGPAQMKTFWKDFKDNYITQEDIHFIAQQGANTIRLPFHYKLFTDEDYMGLSDNTEEGFSRVDKLVEWCRAESLYLILDMHDCPGGQTGDNIDDSYGYPWLLTEESCQEQFLEVWKRIAKHYKNEPVILGYELMNEALATHFDDEYKYLAPLLDKLYKRGVLAIREVDKNHIVLIGGAAWNSRFGEITEWEYDDNLMFTCHRYGGEATPKAIQHYIDTKNKTNRPMYMGEIGHNTNEWQAQFCETMESNNIGYTFWPYKKMDGSCMVGFRRPDGWQQLKDFVDGDRSDYKKIREARAKVGQQEARRMLRELLQNVLFTNCEIQEDYIKSMKLK